MTPLHAINSPGPDSDAPCADPPAGLRTPAVVEASALVEEFSRSHGQWCAALKSLQATLASVDRACQAAVDGQHDPTSKVSELVERIVVAATTETDAAIREVRSEAQSERAEHRGELQAARARLEEERALRLRAEEASVDAERVRVEAASAYELHVRAMQVELESARAESGRLQQLWDAEHVERNRLAAVLYAIQRAVSSLETVYAAETVHAASAPIEALWTADSPTDSPEALPGVEPRGVATFSRVPDPCPEVVMVPPVDRNLTLIKTKQPSNTETRDEPVAYAKELLDQVEAMYWADLESSRSPAEAVNRLTDHLRYARTVFARRVSAADAEPTLFDEQVVELLDAKSATSFGAHLAFSAYEVCAVPHRSQPRSA